MQKLMALLSKDPGDAFCLYGVALEHAKAGDHRSALDWFDRAIAADAASAYAFFHKARSQVEMGHKEQALATLRQGLVAAHKSGDSHAASEISGFLSELSDGAEP